MGNASALVKFLKKVHLGGTVNNCKITTYDDGIWLVEAIDEKTSILLSCQEEFKTAEDWDLGIGDISTLIKWLSIVSNDEIEVSKKDNRLVLKSKGKGTLKYLLQDIDFISTQLEIENDKSPLDKILSAVNLEIKLTADLRTNLISNMSVLKSKLIKLIFKKGEVIFSIGGQNETQISLSIGNVKDFNEDITDDFELLIDGTAFLNALLVAEGTPTLLFAKDVPLVVKQDEKNIWAINIVTQED